MQPNIDNVVIAVRNVSKSYHIYGDPKDRLKQRFFGRFRQFYREFWALKDISFELRKGEALGIIGQNGSGKSTLLQLIAGTLKPTTGEIEIRGRVAALLELGSGFNPEFTGRENVYLNGALLGLSRKEVDDRFDDIASFADIGDFLDQPTKTYSSGMMVRLAFAVQVQIEPDILIVDEALAVGDALFQKRCFQQLEKLTANGTSILFVSHDQEAMRTLTNRSILLAGGKMRASGTSAEVLLEYRKLLHDAEGEYLKRAGDHLREAAEQHKKSDANQPEKTMMQSDRLSFGDGDGKILDVKVLDEKSESCGVFYPGQQMKIQIRFELAKPLEHLNVGVRIRSKEGVKVYSWGTLNQDISILSGQRTGEVFWKRKFLPGTQYTVELAAPCRLGVNLYEVQAALTEEGKPYYAEQRMIHWRDEAAFFQVMMRDREYFFGGAFDLQFEASIT